MSLQVLVTGAGGMLGRDLMPAPRSAGDAVTARTRAELDGPTRPCA